MNNIKRENKGFTLTEVLIATAVLFLIVTGPLRIIINDIERNNITQERVTAEYLAQDLLETIRFARDSAIIEIGVVGADIGGENRDWLQHFSNCGGGVCQRSGGRIGGTAISGLFEPVTTGVNNIYIDGDGRYTENGMGDPQPKLTDFKRTFSLIRLSDDESRIEVSVWWDDEPDASGCGGSERSQCIVFSEVIYRWVGFR